MRTPRLCPLLFTILTLASDGVAAEGAPNGVDQVYPQGRIFPFMGYSGEPKRDGLFGFSVAGPSYAADQAEPLAAAESAGLPFPYKVGLKMNFHAKAPDKPLRLSPEEIGRRIAAQVKAVVDRRSICWWYLGPEELRWWRKNEMEYLSAAVAAIRAADPLKRPIWMYEPNARNAESLKKTGRFLDVIGKGFYVNLAGYRDHRIWVRWSMEQQVQAIAELVEEEGPSGRRRIPIVMPELCCDPEDPGMDHLIPRWARHDVYLGLMCGGKGVAVWSLFRRTGVKRTWPIWYNAYSRVATELTGPLQLGQVFLFGRKSGKFPVTIVSGPKELEVTKGARTELEARTTNTQEKEEERVVYPSLCASEYEHEGATWLFLCNSSATETLSYQSRSLTNDWNLEDVFGARGFNRKDNRLYGYLEPLGVRCFRITAR